MNILVDPEAHPVIAHRGNRAHAPENTLEAFRQALAIGADAVEFDVRTTRDGTLVVMHDATLNRTTSGTGEIRARRLAEVRDLDAGAHFTIDSGRTFPWRGRGITVPTFDEAVETITDRPMVIEVKSIDATEPLRQAIARHNIAHRVLVAGFASKAVHPLRGQGFPLGAATSDAIRLLPSALVGRATGLLPFVAMCLPPTWHGIPVPVGLLARSMHRTGGTLHIWTVNDPVAAREFWRIGVNGIITDDPALMLRTRV